MSAWPGVIDAGVRLHTGVRFDITDPSAWSCLVVLEAADSAEWERRRRVVEALAHAQSRDEATRTASQVRFDEAHRCAVPFRLRSLPAGARLLECSVDLRLNGPDAFTEGSLVVGDESGRWLTVRAQRSPTGVKAGTGELTAGPYRVRRQGSAVLQTSVDPCHVEVFLKGWEDGNTEADGLMVLGGYEPVGDIDDADTWGSP